MAKAVKEKYYVMVYLTITNDHVKHFVRHDRTKAVDLGRLWWDKPNVYKVEVFDSEVDPGNLVVKPHRILYLV